MNKQKAIELLGGSVATAAKAVGISYQAVKKWPEKLSSRIEDRVVAALARMDAAMKFKAEKPADNWSGADRRITDRRSKVRRTDDRRAS